MIKSKGDSTGFEKRIVLKNSNYGVILEIYLNLAYFVDSYVSFKRGTIFQSKFFLHVST